MVALRFSSPGVPHNQQEYRGGFYAALLVQESSHDSTCRHTPTHLLPVFNKLCSGGKTILSKSFFPAAEPLSLKFFTPVRVTSPSQDKQPGTHSSLRAIY
ncbi:hypothetical protein AMECASPLE_018319 [Ameca splendens]|uniref:Uncharacterized protein n=1 Tax=Ameca splendens TaxID=208324 RepID=A0ABV0XRR8_9TELE